jgi:hypothetical protein
MLTKGKINNDDLFFVLFGGLMCSGVMVVMV